MAPITNPPTAHAAGGFFLQTTNNLHKLTAQTISHQPTNPSLTIYQ